MQAPLNANKASKNRSRPRPNFATCAEVNAVLAQFKIEFQAEIDQLRLELAALKTHSSDQIAAQRRFQMSPAQAQRWQAVAAARDRLKAGETEASVQAFLAEQYPTLGAAGILKIALVQIGKR